MMMLPFCENDLWGFMNEKSEVTIAPTYQFARDFSEGLAAVLVDGKYGYVDNQGRMIVQPLFHEAEPFYGGNAVVLDDTGYIVIDKSGRQILSKHYSWLYSFDTRDGLFAVQGDVDGKWGVVDRCGNVVWSFEFDDVQGFDEFGWWMSSQGREHVFRDREGRVMRKFMYDSMTTFESGLSVVCNGDRFGVIDRDGSFVLPIAYYAGQICNSDCICMRLSMDGDFAIYHRDKGEWGGLRFDYCLDARYNGMMFVGHNGKWSLYDENETCLVKGFAEDIQACVKGSLFRFWDYLGCMRYIYADAQGVHVVSRHGSQLLKAGRGL